MITFYDLDDLVKHDLGKYTDSLLGYNFLTKTGSLMVVGNAGVGKSKWTGHLAFSAALGRDFLGMKVHRPVSVLYVQAEDVKEDLAESVQGFVKHDLKSDPVAVKNLKANLNIATVVGITGDDFIRLLDKTCEKLHPEVLILDPLLAFMGCDLVDQGAVTKFLRVQLAQIAHRHNCALICVHHARKDKGTGASIERAFGGIEFGAFFRGVIDLSSDPRDYRSVQMKVAKRQRQLGLKDGLGNQVDSLNLRMGTDGVHWSINDQLSPFDLGPASGRPPKAAKTVTDKTIEEALAAGLKGKEVVSEVVKKHGYSPKQAQRLVKAKS